MLSLRVLSWFLFYSHLTQHTWLILSRIMMLFHSYMLITSESIASVHSQKQLICAIVCPYAFQRLNHSCNQTVSFWILLRAKWCGALPLGNVVKCHNILWPLQIIFNFVISIRNLGIYNNSNLSLQAALLFAGKYAVSVAPARESSNNPVTHLLSHAFKAQLWRCIHEWVAEDSTPSLAICSECCSSIDYIFEDHAHQTNPPRIALATLPTTNWESSCFSHIPVLAWQ